MTHQIKIHYFHFWGNVVSLFFIAGISFVVYYFLGLFFLVSELNKMIYSALFFLVVYILWIFVSRGKDLIDVENDILSPFSASKGNAPEYKVDNPYKKIQLYIKDAYRKMHMHDVDSASIDYNRIIGLFPQLNEHQRDSLLKRVFLLKREIMKRKEQI